VSCCGSQRAALRQDSAHIASPAHHWVAGAVEFEYTGHGQLTVTGPLTGVTYQFTGHGARVQVYGSDAPSIVSVPSLRLVR